MPGSTATLSSERRDGGGEAEFEGSVEAVSPTGTFTVSGRSVSTNASTVFRQGSAVVSISALSIGQRVRVRGRTVGDTLLATDVDIRSARDDGPGQGEVERTGVIGHLAGDASSFSFTIGGASVAAMRRRCSSRHRDLPG